MRIILAVDGSPFSDAAVQALIAQAQSKDAEIRVLHVLERPNLLSTREMGGYDSLEKAWETEKKHAQGLRPNSFEALRKRDPFPASDPGGEMRTTAVPSRYEPTPESGKKYSR